MPAILNQRRQLPPECKMIPKIATTAADSRRNCRRRCACCAVGWLPGKDCPRTPPPIAELARDNAGYGTPPPPPGLLIAPERYGEIVSPDCTRRADSANCPARRASCRRLMPGVKMTIAKIPPVYGRPYCRNRRLPYCATAAPAVATGARTCRLPAGTARRMMLEGLFRRALPARLLAANCPRSPPG